MCRHQACETFAYRKTPDFFHPVLVLCIPVGDSGLSSPAGL